jgi:hypothetical protein
VNKKKTRLEVFSYLIHDSNHPVGESRVTIERVKVKRGFRYVVSESSSFLNKKGFWVNPGLEEEDNKDILFTSPKVAHKFYLKWKGKHKTKTAAHLAHSKKHGLID